MFLHKMPEPVYGCEFRMVMIQISAVGDPTEDIQIILRVGSERRAVEEAGDDFDGPPVLFIAADRVGETL